MRVAEEVKCCTLQCSRNRESSAPFCFALPKYPSPLEMCAGSCPKPPARPSRRHHSFPASRMTADRGRAALIGL